MGNYITQTLQGYINRGSEPEEEEYFTASEGPEKYVTPEMRLREKNIRFKSVKKKLYAEIRSLERTIQGLKSIIEAKDRKLLLTATSFENLKTENKHLDETLRQTSNILLEKATECESYQEQHQTLRKKICTLQQESQTVLAASEKKDSTILSQAEEIKSYQEQHQTLRKKISTLQQESQTVLAANEKKDSTILSQAEEIKRYKDESNKLQNEIVNLKSALRTSQDDNVKKISSIALHLKTIQNYREENETLRKKTTSLQTVSDASEKKKATILSQAYKITSYKEENQSLRTRNNSLQEELQTVSAAIEEKKANIVLQANKIKRLEEEKTDWGERRKQLEMTIETSVRMHEHYLKKSERAERLLRELKDVVHKEYQEAAYTLKCFICYERVKDPMVGSCCRSVLGCKECLSKWFTTKNTCPKCRRSNARNSCFCLKELEHVFKIVSVVATMFETGSASP